MPAVQNVATGEITQTTQTPVLRHGVWEGGNKRFTDPTGTLFVPVATLSTTPSVTDFWELFTVEEEAAIRLKGTTDAPTGAWLRRLDDPRTVQVNLAFPSVINAITYVAGTIPLAPGRLAQILAGIPPS